MSDVCVFEIPSTCSQSLPPTAYRDDDDQIAQSILAGGPCNFLHIIITVQRVRRPSRRMSMIVGPCSHRRTVAIKSERDGPFQPTSHFRQWNLLANRAGLPPLLLNGRPVASPPANSIRRPAVIIGSCRAMRSAVDSLKSEVNELKSSMATVQQPAEVH